MIKLTTTQAKALLNAFPESSYATGGNTGAVQLCGDVRKSTRGALIRMGMVVPSGLYLTVRGHRAVIAVQEAVNTQNVYTQGCKIDLPTAEDDSDLYDVNAGVQSVIDHMATLDRARAAAETEPMIPDAVADTSVMIAETLGSVVVEGVDPSEFAPDFLASGAAECYFTSSTCVGPVVAVFVDYVGRTEGVCVAHRERVEGTTHELPTVPVVEAQTPTQRLINAIREGEMPTACVVQNTPGMNGVNHYHSPACADVKREMRKWGQTRDDVMHQTFSDVASILAFEYGDIASDSEVSGTPEWWTEVIINARVDQSTEYGMGVRVMPCLSRLPMGMAGVQELAMVKGMYTLVNVLENRKCYVCQTHGDVSMPGSEVDGEWLCGFCADSGITPGNLRSHTLNFYCETERAGTKFECDGCGCIGTRSDLGKFMCATDEPVPHSFNLCDVPACTECAAILFNACQEAHGGDNDCAACTAYVSALPVVPEPCEGAYAAIASLTTGAGFHTVTDAPEGDQDNDSDAGFVESMVTMEYRLSVIVDETTGATVDLGWVVLTMNAAQAMDHRLIAATYGAVHGEGHPRGGWESIIRVHAIEAL